MRGGKRAASRALLLGLFFLSGGAGLMYEVVWSRRLALEMGSTAYALATILTVFMGGLALGSWIGGRVARRIRRPLRVYGLLEVAIGLLALATPALIDATHPAMRAIYVAHSGNLLTMSVLQFALCGAVMLPAVVCMGATLPIVAERVARGGAIARSVGLVYGLNSLGAFFGCVSAGLVLTPNLGEFGTSLIAVGLNIGVGIVALVASVRTENGEGEHAAAQAERALEKQRVVKPAEAEIPLGPSAGVVLLGFGVSGFAAMTLQTAWTRLIGLSIGHATYAFSIIVGAFILGLALGSAVIGRLGDRPGRAAPLLIACQAGIAFLAALTIPLFGELPVRVAVLISKRPEDFRWIQFIEFALVFGVVIGPTFLMGGMLPLVCRHIAAGREAARGAVARVVGRAYASNTVGTILGAAAAGFVLIPLLGMRGSILVGVGLNALVAAAYLIGWRGWGFPALRAGLASAGLIALTVVSVAIPAWDKATLTSGPYVSAAIFTARAQRAGIPLREFLRRQNEPIIEYREGVSTLVTVKQMPNGEKSLIVSGKQEALGWEFTQAYLAHLPLGLHPAPRSALVIGLGSGNTLTSATLHRSLERIDVVEIAREVIDAAVEHFGAGPALRDPRVRLIEGDGRLHLAMTDMRYDVVMSQPSNPWMAGASSLFTVEAFRLMRERLNEGGVACVWFQGFQITPSTMRTLLATFHEAFPEFDVWRSRVGGDFLLTGYTGEKRIDPARVDRLLGEREVARDLRRDAIADAADFLGHFVADAEHAMAFAAGADLNTDDRTVLEDRIPRAMFTPDASVMMVEAAQSMASHIETRLVEAPEGDAVRDAFVGRVRGIAEANALVEGFILGRAERPGPDVLARVRSLDPRNWWAQPDPTRPR